MPSGIRLYFSKDKSWERKAKIFSENRIPGMLEAKSNNNLNIISPFFGKTIYMCWGNSSDAPVTDNFTG